LFIAAKCLPRQACMWGPVVPVPLRKSRHPQIAETIEE
jgi:hypothetical protein